MLDTIETGIVLTGTEVKSLRMGNANLADGYAMLKNGEVWLLGMHVSPYEHGSYANVDPRRERKLLVAPEGNPETCSAASAKRDSR